jgi:hypothetical protein
MGCDRGEGATEGAPGQRQIWSHQRSPRDCGEIYRSAEQDGAARTHLANRRLNCGMLLLSCQAIPKLYHFWRQEDS